MTALTVYLAPPDVFLPDSRANEEAKKATLARRNVTGVSPMDNKIDDFNVSSERLLEIYNCARERRDQCNVILANLTPWGTIHELTYEVTKGRLVIGYYEGNPKLYAQSVIKHYKMENTNTGKVLKFIKESGGEIYSSFEEAVNNIERLWMAKQSQAN
jgi:nucleoside 2-deoxyribosyltransferase